LRGFFIAPGQTGLQRACGFPPAAHLPHGWQSTRYMAEGITQLAAAVAIDLFLFKIL
jgi:hypothetical protein